MSQSHAFLRVARLLHLYLGAFTAPALLFFAFTGALQTFSLHETSQGSSYKPPAWIASLAQLHKKQTTEVPVRRPRLESAPPCGPGSSAHHDAGTSAHGNAENAPAPKPRFHTPMKIFFLFVSIGLFVSTVTGIYMSYRYSRNPLLITGLLLAGIALPLLLLQF